VTGSGRRGEDAVEAFAAHAAGARLADLPPAALAAAKTFILDTLGVAIAGSGDPYAARLADAVAGWGAGTEATVLGTGRRLPAQGAAFVNAFQIHGLEFDCLHEPAVVHPMATVLGALLAQVERRGGASGADLLVAAAVGVDVAAGVGMAARAPMSFFRPATAGGLGAVAAVARLEGWDADRLVNALGIVGGHLAGTMQAHSEGSRLLPVQMAFNARGALTAVDLAESGLVGPRRVLEGEFGFFALFERDQYDLRPSLAALGREWQVARLSHKPFCSGRATHGAIDGVLQLRRRHGFAAGDVARVRALVPPLVQRLVGRPDVPSPSASYARLCLPFAVATALRHGAVDVPHFTPAALADPETHALAARVSVEVDGNRDPNALAPQAVEIELRGGARLAAALPAVVGSPDVPLGRAAHLDKFRRCWGHGARPAAAERGERLIALVDGLEAVPDARALIALCAP
jgi:2-methylcitrate dehydratase PrpD